jgi:hypothetical protein
MADAALATAPYERMSAPLLAAQPATMPDVAQDEVRDWNDIYTHLEARLGWLRTWRYSWWAYWSVLARFFLPRRYHWVIVANRMSRGNPINDAIIDSTGTMAMQTCARGMWSGFTNPSRPWLKLGIHGIATGEDIDADAKAWLEDTEQRLYAIMDGSNFYSEFAQAFEDLATFGTAPLIIYEDYEDVIRLYGPCAGEYFLALGGRLAVDSLYREFTLTILQLVEMFGFDACPEEVQRLWVAGGASLDTEKVVAHAIEPNFPISRKGQWNSQIRPLPPGFVFREFYWLRGAKTPKPLSKRGFYKKPFIALRWSKTSNDAYGRSPGMDALGDVKQVQTETLRKAEFIEKGVRPPMGADIALKNEPASIMPAHITFMDSSNSKKGFWALFEVQAQWLAALVADIDKVNGRVDKAFYVNVFMAITQMDGVQPRNELELTKRDLERLQVLGPVIDIVEGELAIATERNIDIAESRGLLLPRPKSLQGRFLKIEFITLMRIAQRSASSVAMKDFLATMGGLSSVAKAAEVDDPLREVDLSFCSRKYADDNNVPTGAFFSKTVVQQHDAARAQAKQQAAAPGAAMAAVQAAKTLSETPTGGGSALSALTGGGGGGQSALP